MRILVDTSVWGDYFNGVVTPRTDYLDGLLGRTPLVMGNLILTEAVTATALTTGAILEELKS